MPEHVSSKKLYFTIFATLLVLTYLTVAISKIDLGPFNTVVALTIACTKAVLVVLFFMHVRYSSRMTKLVVIGGFVWLGILITGTLTDVLTRGWLAIIEH
jgi:cytochrome c oxidase subunit 4